MTDSRKATGRVNARLDADAAEKLATLAKDEGRSISDVLRAAIERYYEQSRAAHVAAIGALERNGFVGCAEGDSDLSKTYKHHLTNSLRRKHGDR
jgi:predicted DNA-binding protein